MQAASNLPPGFHLLALDAVDSTNDEARRLAETGAPDRTLVWAASQSGGRGRHGRQWQSPPGNCYSSLLLRPAVPPAAAAQISFVTALALAEAVTLLLPAGRKVSCKWPNDVLVDGAKISGILLESRMTRPGRVDWLIVGAGINVAHHPAESDYPVTSLHAAGGSATVEQTLATYVARLETWLGRWHRDGFAAVRQAWLDRADGLGQAVRVRLPDRTLNGVFEALDESGALVLLDSDGSRRAIAAGDVYRAA